MKIDKNLISTLLTLDDDKLWKTINLLIFTMTGKSGASVEKPENLNGLRAVMESVTDAEIERIYELTDIYKAAAKEK